MKILVAIPKPPDGQPNTQSQWQTLVDNIEAQVQTKATADVERLGQGAWLILSEKGMPCIGIALAAAGEKQFSYRVLVLHESADWRYEPAAGLK